MGLREQLVNQLSKVAAQCLHQTVGVKWRYYNEEVRDGVDFTEIISYPMSVSTDTRNQFGTQRVNDNTVVVQVPKQFNHTGHFPPDRGIMNGDRLVLVSDDQEVFQVKSSISDDLGIMFDLTCVRVRFKSTMEQES